MRSNARNEPATSRYELPAGAGARSPDDPRPVELDEGGTERQRATLTCPNGGELPPTLRGYPVALWAMRFGDVTSSVQPPPKPLPR